MSATRPLPSSPPRAAAPSPSAAGGAPAARAADAPAVPAPAPSAAARWTLLLYGVLTYALFLGTFVYAMGFVGGFLVPRTIDGGTSAPLRDALLVDAALLLLFAVQHNVMARPWFKARWTRIVPPAAERSTFVLLTCAILIALFVHWRALPEVVWRVGSPAGAAALWTLHALGWAIVLLSTFLIDHFELFGLKQVVRHARGQPEHRTPFAERSLYRLVRHPLMLGFIIAFWSAPVMTVGRLVFAAVTTLWILFALQIEERTLLALHGEAYADYRRRVPMLIPRWGRARAG